MKVWFSRRDNLAEYWGRKAEQHNFELRNPCASCRFHNPYAGCTAEKCWKEKKEASEE